MKKAFALVTILLVAACAPAQKGTMQSVDPYESFNRGVFSFNEVVDTVLFRPVAKTYQVIVPEIGRKGIRNALRNFYEPVTMANSLLQGDEERFFTSMWRFILNTTLGFGGLYDFAGENTELKYREEDFGQTIAVWAGHDESPYLVVPFLGPSTTRDAFGRIVDIALDPWNYGLRADESIGIAVLDGVSQRANADSLIDEIYESSLDPYASFRSIYLQRRAAQIKNTHNPNEPQVN